MANLRSLFSRPSEPELVTPSRQTIMPADDEVIDLESQPQPQPRDRGPVAGRSTFPTDVTDVRDMRAHAAAAAPARDAASPAATDDDDLQPPEDDGAPSDRRSRWATWWSRMRRPAPSDAAHADADAGADARADGQVPADVADAISSHAASATTAAVAPSSPDPHATLRGASIHSLSMASRMRAGHPVAESVPIDAADASGYAQTAMLGENDLLIGDLLRQTANLSADQIQAVLEHQRQNDLRFGESAVALGYVTDAHVIWALSKQYGYDYTPQPFNGDASRLSDDLVIAKHPFSRAAETIRDLRSQLLAGVLNPDVLPHRALALVSPNSGDGKTWLAANLAVSLSQVGARTLLIDANLRTPRLHDVFGIKPRTGLTGILMRRHKADVLRPVRELPNLYLLPAGTVPPNPLEILQGRGFVDLLIKLRGKFTHVIVDTPPMEFGADARLIAARCGASALIGRRHVSSLAALQDISRQLSKGDAQFAGLILNDN